MTNVGHPPAFRRCQIYVGTDLRRCINEGTHWVSWGGCSCDSDDPMLCEDAFESWECDGPHNPETKEAA